MPPPGGTADKLGNRYEAFLAIDQLLRIVRREATQLILEPLDSIESAGIEFRVSLDNGVEQYFSAKRQTTGAAGWTLAKLTQSIRGGNRSILQDLFEHLRRSPKHCAVFASSQDVPQLRELSKYASDPETFKIRLDGNKDLQRAFNSYVVPLCDDNPEQGRTLVTRVSVWTEDEDRLRNDIESRIRATFCKADGSEVDAAVVRGLCGDLLLDNIHELIDRNAVLNALLSHGLILADWSNDLSVLGRVEQRVMEYTKPIVENQIGGCLLALPGSESILNSTARLAHNYTVLTGPAGSGKSVTIAAMVQHLLSEHIPVIPLRFDEFTEGIVTTVELGRKLDLPSSPVMVLANIAKGEPAVLVVDQLDAISTTSGRNIGLWDLFEKLVLELRGHPNIQLLVGCREFDLKHDPRIRALTKSEKGFLQIKLGKLSQKQVEEVLISARLEPKSVPATLRETIQLPIHLWMFLELSPDERFGVKGVQSLCTAFWSHKEHQLRRRLSGNMQWIPAVDAAIDWLSTRQQLAFPQAVLDGHGTVADALVSEGVLVLTEQKQLRFFHESFFDYAFARRFIGRGKSLHSFLAEDEQGLFRRAQTRQVLAYLRDEDEVAYLEELDSLLISERVRFHIKRLILQFLGSIEQPKPKELEILTKLGDAKPEARRFVYGTMYDSPGWFDVLDSQKYFDTAFESGDIDRINQATWTLSSHRVLEERADRVASILLLHWRNEPGWQQRLHTIFFSGVIHGSRMMFDFFLSRIDDGSLDTFRPHMASNDTWWDVLHSSLTKRPDLACEAIGRRIQRLCTLHPPESDAAGLREVLRDSGSTGGYVISKCAEVAPEAFVRHVLPQIRRMIQADLHSTKRDRLPHDSFFLLRGFGDNVHSDLDALRVGLAGAMMRLAKSDSERLDTLISEPVEAESDSLAYFVLRAWTAAPEHYGERLATYLSDDSRRLKIGYGIYGTGGGSGTIFVSRQAVSAASIHCTDAAYRSLETAILNLRDESEEERPRFRGSMQLDLLCALKPERLSTHASAKIEELRLRFGRLGGEEPKASEFREVPSPIPIAAQDKMNDAQWIRALKKYAGKEGWPLGESARGGERQLANSLQAHAKKDPLRFSALGLMIPPEFPPAYIGAVLRGIADYRRANQGEEWGELGLRAARLIEYAHNLANHPCGSEICWLIQNWREKSWPNTVVEIVAWYAENDPDPTEEIWKKEAASGQVYYDGNPFDAGINTVRGAAAEAIGALIASDQSRYDFLKHAVSKLVHDDSTAVRTVALVPLQHILAIDPEQAVSWAVEIFQGDEAILKARPAEWIIYASAARFYGALRGTLQRMLALGNDDIVAASARQICLAAFENDAAKDDAETIVTGSVTMRRAAAEIYATNVANKDVGPLCLLKLGRLFNDDDSSVRESAAHAFRNLDELPLGVQEELFRLLLMSQPPISALFEPLRALEQSAMRLPESTCSLVERCVEAIRTNKGEQRSHSDYIAVNVILRAYKQTGDTALRKRCLDVIDSMEELGFGNLDAELDRFER